LADDSKNDDVGQRYAQALFELAQGGESLIAVEADLKGLKALYRESPDLRRLLIAPGYTTDDKAKGLDAVAAAANYGALTRKFLGLLARNRRASALPAVIAAFERLAAQARGTVSAEVVSAVPLSDTQLAAVKASLSKALGGKSPELEARVDPSILGGLKVRVGSRLFDSSLKTRLDQMKYTLKRAPAR
jgi:F-type H+-transporting ATPase subunit delta